MNITVKGFFNGLMVYWDEVQDASRYYVHLLINDREIAVVEVERNMKYY